MNKYNQSKIYKIVDDTNGNIYIGSTIEKYISARLSKHVSDYKSFTNGSKKFYSSFKIFENCSFHIELLEDYNCSNRFELRRREGFYIKKYADSCVNIQVAGQTQKEYRDINKGKMKEYLITYRKNNVERQREYDKLRVRSTTHQRLIYHFVNSWGGDPRNNNNLLRISSKVFN